jgi:peptidyl-dipeptidase Dcp
VTNTRSSTAPFLTFSENRELRKQVWSAYYSRGDNGDKYDNNALISEILQLRHERVGLLGYDNYAQWRLEDRVAQNPENAMALLESIWLAAVARLVKEVADTDNPGMTIEPWDYGFYTEKVPKLHVALDSDEVKQYLQLEKLTEAMFYVHGELFNFCFTSVAEGNITVFHPDVSVWEVSDKSTETNIGLWYLDPFTRKGKRSCTWATSYRSHSTIDGKTTVLSANNSNFVKAPDRQPVLIYWDDARSRLSHTQRLKITSGLCR